MKCHKCKVNKLHREFPHEALNEDCDHAALHCLRCTTEFVEKHQQCSMCNHPVALDNPRYQECVYTLKRLFPDVGAPKAIPSSTATPDTPSENETIKVSVMGGEVAMIPFDAIMTVNQLKNKIQENFKIKPEQQRLLYQDKEIKSSKEATLQDHNVQPSSTIYLVVILYHIPDSFDEVIFDLSWDFPTVDSIPVKDYLDASVLLYSGASFEKVLNWKDRESKQYPAVCHSGDRDDNVNHTGHQTIKVKIKSLSKHIDKLFFTLSAWESKNISKYPSPSLRFYDARYPKTRLCDDSLTHATDSQAVIMCSMCKSKEGKWQVLSLKCLCNGNAKNYVPIQETITELITNGMS